MVPAKGEKPIVTQTNAFGPDDPIIKNPTKANSPKEFLDGVVLCLTLSNGSCIEEILSLPDLKALKGHDPLEYGVMGKMTIVKVQIAPFFRPGRWTKNGGKKEDDQD